MIEINNVKEISYDFEKKEIIVSLKQSIFIKGYMRAKVSKKGSYQDFCEYSKKINNFKL